ncbi:MAG: serine/threonine protein kinase [Lentisphaeraceae bacterium]|nr:serine/threonine protein kinase [Lentisphaeraceae bacterium]
MDDLLKNSTPEEREALFDSLNEDLLQVFDEDIVNLDDEIKFPLSHAAENEAPGEHSIKFHEEIGRGGMKVIHRCEVKISGEILAIATLKNKGDQKSVERFLKEAKITEMLKHENIVELYDYGVHDSHGPYMAMHFSKGISLASILQEISLGTEEFIERFPLKKRLEIFKKVAAAISYAHSEGVVHLDIKPENVLVDDVEKKVFICDWGLARILPEFETIENYALTSQSGVFLKGSPGYMAPEQISQKEKTASTDIYQLGGLLYAILFYRSPVEGQDVEEILEKTVTGQLDLPEDEEENDLVVLIQKALEVDPSERFLTVDEMMQSFNKINATFIALEKRQQVLLNRQISRYKHEAVKYRVQAKKAKKDVVVLSVVVCVMLVSLVFFMTNDEIVQPIKGFNSQEKPEFAVPSEVIDAENSYYKILRKK